MNIRYVLSVIVSVLSLSGSAIAGNQVQVANVPAFTPWGAIITAAVFGISGLYTLLKKK